MFTLCEHLTLAFLRGFAEPQCEHRIRLNAHIILWLDKVSMNGIRKLLNYPDVISVLSGLRRIYLIITR